MALNIYQNIYITALVVFVVASICFIFYFYLKPKYEKKHFVSLIGKQMYKLAVDLDLLLINNFKLNKGNEESLINHIVFGKKFIYLINDFYFDGAIEAEKYDKNATFFQYKKKVKYIKNPLMHTLSIHNEFINKFPGDSKIFKSIVVFNDDLILEMDTKDMILCKRNEINSVLKGYESIDIKGFCDSELLDVAKKIDILNKRNKNES